MVSLPPYSRDKNNCSTLLYLAYFVSLGLGHEEASELHLKYYTQYGLTLRGLTRHHDVGNVTWFLFPLPPTNMSSTDPLDFDRKCDQAIPLEEMISYDEEVRKLFEDIDRSRVRVWALTNAYCVVRSPIFSRYYGLLSKT